MLLKSFKTLSYSLFLSSILMSQTYAFSACQEAQEIKKDLDDVKITLSKVEKKLSRAHMDEEMGVELNTEIRSRLKNLDDQAEVAVLAEMLDEQSSMLVKDQFSNVGMIGASTGALTVAYLLVKKINASPKRIQIKAKLFKKEKTITLKGKKISMIKGGLHFMGFWALIGEIYYGNQVYENHKVRDLLTSMVVELNKIETLLAEELLPYRRYAEELQLELDELVDEGYITIKNSKILCTGKSED